ncbi:hypothetical protein HDZ31DRAFT_68159, partial [Schizophyllum fasciatum]
MSDNDAFVVDSEDEQEFARPLPPKPPTEDPVAEVSTPAAKSTGDASTISNTTTVSAPRPRPIKRPTAQPSTIQDSSSTSLNGNNSLETLSSTPTTIADRAKTRARNAAHNPLFAGEVIDVTDDSTDELDTFTRPKKRRTPPQPAPSTSRSGKDPTPQVPTKPLSSQPPRIETLPAPPGTSASGSQASSTSAGKRRRAEVDELAGEGTESEHGPPPPTFLAAPTPPSEKNAPPAPEKTPTPPPLATEAKEGGPPKKRSRKKAQDDDDEDFEATEASKKKSRARKSKAEKEKAPKKAPAKAKGKGKGKGKGKAANESFVSAETVPDSGDEGGVGVKLAGESSSSTAPGALSKTPEADKPAAPLAPPSNKRDSATAQLDKDEEVIDLTDDEHVVVVKRSANQRRAKKARIDSDDEEFDAGSHSGAAEPVRNATPPVEIVPRAKNKKGKAKAGTRAAQKKDQEIAPSLPPQDAPAPAESDQSTEVLPKENVEPETGGDNDGTLPPTRETTPVAPDPPPLQAPLPEKPKPTSLTSRYSIAPRTKSTPMSELIKRVNSHAGSPFPSRSSFGGTAYSPYLKASKRTLSKIAP